VIRQRLDLRNMPEAVSSESSHSLFDVEFAACSNDCTQYKDLRRHQHMRQASSYYYFPKRLLCSKAQLLLWLLLIAISDNIKAKTLHVLRRWENSCTIAEMELFQRLGHGNPSAMFSLLFAYFGDFIAVTDMYFLVD
jgi:hypothetical protein